MLLTFFRVAPKMAQLISVGLFGISLFSDAFYRHVSDSQSAFPGWQLFFFGWSAIPHGGASWLANPALCAAWLYFARGYPIRSAGLSVLGLALMASFLSVDEVTSVYASSSAAVAGYGVGYKLWVASAIVSLLGGIIAVMPTEFLNPSAGDSP